MGTLLNNEKQINIGYKTYFLLLSFKFDYFVASDLGSLLLPTFDCPGISDTTYKTLCSISPL